MPWPGWASPLGTSRGDGGAAQEHTDAVGIGSLRFISAFLTAQTISFPPLPTPAYAGTSVGLTAVASSGLPVTYRVVSGPAIVNGLSLTYTGAGTVVVEADQAGTGGFGAATPVQNTVTVTLLTEPVGTASPVVSTAVTFTAAGTLGSVAVMTLGAQNLDFSFVPGGTCQLAAVYQGGQSCTVIFAFSPTRPGLRYGGIALTASDGATLGNSYIFGEGTGPQLNFLPVLQSAVGSGLEMASGVAVNGNGDLFVSSRRGQTVTEFPAGGGAAIPLGSFTDAEDVAVDGSGNVFVITGRNTVNEFMAVNGTIPPAPTMRTLASQATFSGLSALNGLKVDQNGDVFLANSLLSGSQTAVYEIQAVNGSIPASPTILTLGSGFGGPTGVAVDASGDVYVSDETRNAVFEIGAVNGSIPASPVITQLGSGFNSPSNVSLDANNNVYVADYGNHAIKKLLAVNGAVPLTNATIETLGSGFVEPEGLVIDGSGNVFVADSGLASVAKLDYADPPTLSFAATTVGATSSDSPQTVTLINDGNAGLEFTPGSTGVDPTITPGFVVDDSSTCPQLPTLNDALGPLAPGQTCTYAVSFQPVVPGPDSGFLQITDNDLNAVQATQSVPLNGVGIATVAPTAVLQVAPNPAYVGQAVTIVATVQGTGSAIPSGTVTILDGSATLGTPSLDAGGQATLVTSTLSVGTHTLTAVYAGSGAFSGVTSPPVQEVILSGTFAVTLSPAVLSLAPGQQGSTTVELSSIGEFSGPITLQYGQLPSGASATLSQSTVTLAAGGSATALFRLNTLQQTASGGQSESPFGRRRWTGIAAACLLALPVWIFRRKRLRSGLIVPGLVLLGLVSLQAFTGCTTIGSKLDEVAPGSYQIPITATDAQGTAQTVTLTLNLTGS